MRRFSMDCLQKVVWVEQAWVNQNKKFRMRNLFIKNQY